MASKYPRMVEVTGETLMFPLTSVWRTREAVSPVDTLPENVGVVRVMLVADEPDGKVLETVMFPLEFV